MGLGINSSARVVPPNRPPHTEWFGRHIIRPADAGAIGLPPNKTSPMSDVFRRDVYQRAEHPRTPLRENVNVFENLDLDVGQADFVCEEEAVRVLSVEKLFFHVFCVFFEAEHRHNDLAGPWRFHRVVFLRCA